MKPFYPKKLHIELSNYDRFQILIFWMVFLRIKCIYMHLVFYFAFIQVANSDT